MSESGLRELVFLTVHNENGERNPRSVLVVEALKQHGCAVVVLDSPLPAKPALAVSVVVALFDVDFGVNRWSPRPNTASGTPGWAHALSTGSCVAVGRKCVTFPPITARAARQIAVLFSREFRKDAHHEYPWGPSPSPSRRKRRTRNLHLRRYRMLPSDR